MCIEETPYCPDCIEPAPVHAEEMSACTWQPEATDRRTFMRMMGGGAAAMLALGAGAGTFAAEKATAAGKAASSVKAVSAKPAEDLIRELYAALKPDQKKKLVLPFDHGKGKPTRHGMYNRPLNQQRIADHYTKPQQELVHRIFKSILNGEEGYRTISRNNTWDSSKSFEGCGAHIFGDPTGKQEFAWLFTGHHLTVRCDGNSQPGAAFGGPLYYGHSVRGDSKKNAYNYQTQSVKKVYEALDEKQREAGLVIGTPGERSKSIKFRSDEKAIPGAAYADLSKDQQKLVEDVMRSVLSPFRKEDGDEVMQIIKANGGMDKIHLAFYKDEEQDEQWHFWRLEGPGFVWNYRVLPHVHCFVNISSEFQKAALAKMNRTATA